MQAVERSTPKTTEDLGREALWFGLHTLLAILILAAVLAAITSHQPTPDSPAPKLLATVLAFFAPCLAGLVIAYLQQHRAAAYIWVAGIVFLAAVSVWVLDLPTASGLCERCGPIEKLTRTFFTFDHGSGFLEGQGLLIGTWIPLSMIGYSLGARFALSRID